MPSFRKDAAQEPERSGSDLRSFRRSGSVRQAHKTKAGLIRPQSRAVHTDAVVVDWLAGPLGEAPAVAAQQRLSLRMPRLGMREIRRSFAIGLAVCLIVAASVFVFLPSGQPGAAASDTTDPVALASLPSPSPTDISTPGPTESPTLKPTPQPRIALPIAGTAFMSYTVRPGDTLTRIANDFGLSVPTLYWANASVISDPQMIKVGQELLVPPIDGLPLVIPAGATLKSIAEKYGIDTQVIIDANALTSDTLTVGQMLIIPGVDTPPLPVPPTPTPRPRNWYNQLWWPTPSSHNITQLFGCTGWYGEPAWGGCRHFHDGLDIGARWGSAVEAAAAGKVIYAGWRKAGTDGAAGGIVVWISHGGTLFTTYNHLSAVTVKAGQRVVMGQLIGKIGSTGASSGAHVHFEVWVAYPWTGGNIADARNPLLYTKWKP